MTATASTFIYTLSLHDALPISRRVDRGSASDRLRRGLQGLRRQRVDRPRIGDPHLELTPDGRDRSLLRLRDRKSTRLNSSHLVSSYAVFCLKKKNLKVKKLIDG